MQRELNENHDTADNNDNTQIGQWMEQLIASGTLVRLSIVKGKGVHLSIPGRILSYDKTAETITVYHVDEKKVYLLKLNEIDDFIAS